MRRTVITITGIVVALALIGAAFWGGMNTGKAQAQSEQNAFFASRGINPNGAAAGANGAAGFTGQGANGAAFRANRGVSGTIQSVNGNTITVQDNQGNTVTVTMASGTTIVKTVLGNASDLVVGRRIIAQGDRSGNNVAATGIQVTDTPAGVNDFFGGRRATPTPTPSK